MRRRQAGTSMRASPSNRTSPSSLIWPRSGLSSPAIILMTLVLPAPEGPNKTVAPLSLANDALSVNAPSVFSIFIVSTSLSVQPRGGAARQPFRCDKRGERDDHGDGHQRERGAIAARHLRERVDRRRDSLRFAGNVGHEGDGGAEFTEGAGEGQHHAGD